MHERKAAMAQEAEAFIALPGEFLKTSKQVYICFLHVFLKRRWLLVSIRRLWNYGGTAGDYYMGTAWYP